jgi:FlaA1/EpsC-like NDP-sugar epimerase
MKRGFLKIATLVWIIVHAGISVTSLIVAEALFSVAQKQPFNGWFVFFSSILTSAVLVSMLMVRKYNSTKAKYFGLHDAQSILFACVLGGIAGMFWAVLVGSYSVPQALILLSLYSCLTAFGILTLRLIRRKKAIKRITASSNSTKESVKVLIVGAGDAGEGILREIHRNPNSKLSVVGFVDDSLEKRDLVIHGVRVLGSVDDLPKIVHQQGVRQLIIAMPSATPGQLQRVYTIANIPALVVKTLPSVQAVVNGSGARLLPKLRPIEIEDLLRRDSVQTDLRQVCAYISSERVLITGAGGSIGSEIARQVSKLNPECIILLGRGENSIFEIQQELSTLAPGVRTYSVIADVRNQEAIESVMSELNPSVIFHAAAHKHVPLMEGNPKEAITNNIRGTLNIAEAAVRHGAKKFVLISTDKAVNPSSVMGATKRVCEKIIMALGQESKVEFSAVRFGNVLGSRGSLIPLIQSQIRRGGPVTVTDPEMTRYFMTIPEATQLVLQAGAIGKSGDIYILDMGEPVKIIDIVTELIRMHDLTPNVDIDIKYTGMRPGEKLHEILNYDNEGLIPTVHSKIKTIPPNHSFSIRDLRVQIEHLERGHNSKSLTADLHKLAGESSLRDDIYSA